MKDYVNFWLDLGRPHVKECNLSRISLVFSLLEWFCRRYAEVVHPRSYDDTEVMLIHRSLFSSERLHMLVGICSSSLDLLSLPFCRSCHHRASRGTLVPPCRRQHSNSLVVPAQTVDSGLDQNQPELAVLVLAVALQVLAHCHRLLDQHVEVFWNLRSQAYKCHSVSLDQREAVLWVCGIVFGSSFWDIKCRCNCAYHCL